MAGGNGNLIVAASSFGVDPNNPSPYVDFALDVARILLPGGTIDSTFGAGAGIVDAGQDGSASPAGVVEIPLGTAVCDAQCGSPTLALPPDAGIVIDKLPPATEDDGLAAFNEWASPADERAYADL